MLVRARAARRRRPRAARCASRHDAGASRWFPWARVGRRRASTPPRGRAGLRPRALGGRRALVRRARGDLSASCPRSTAGPVATDVLAQPAARRLAHAMLGSVLLVGVGIVAVTGLLSHAAYQPDLGGNAPRPEGHRRPRIGWPTRPAGCTRFTQGLHVTIGIVDRAAAAGEAVVGHPAPVRVAAGRPAPAHALERLAILLLVGRAIFQFATGIANAQLYYPWHFDFVGGALLRRAGSSSRRSCCTCGQGAGDRRAYATRREVLGPERRRLRAARSRRPRTLSRRGLFGLVRRGAPGRSSVTTAGQSIGGPLRERGAPRAARRPAPTLPGQQDGGRRRGSRRRWSARLPARSSSAATERELTLAELLAMPQHTYDLPIACVEGWSTTQAWTGVRLRDLAARRRGARRRGAARSARCSRAARSARRRSAPARSPTRTRCWRCGSTARTLSLDHGYPARVIVPALPGVHCTKWVKELHFT